MFLAAAVTLTASTAHAQLIITEIMHSPGGDDALWEWIEVVNASSQSVNLHGWVFDDDDDPSIAAANINAADGNTVIPAGGVAVLYPGDELDFTPERFNSAWGGGITLIGVNGFTSLTAGDAIGLWSSLSSYQSDTLPSTVSPRRTFTHAVTSISYSTGFPTAATGHSIAWTGGGTSTNGANWIQSEAGSQSAFASIETTTNGAPVNSIADRGNPGVLTNTAAAAGVLITEIMFAPASPIDEVGFDQADFEWVEVFNNTGQAIDFESQPYVFDDIAGSKLTLANVSTGAIAAGEIGVLFNAERITVGNMQAMWGEDFNYIPVTSWPALNNSGGDTIAIWDSYADYNSEPVTGTGRTHENAVADVTYDTVAGDDWPTINNESSIWLNNLAADPNNGASWTRAGAAGDTLSRQAAAIFATVIDHEGDDVGSPGIAPAIQPSASGDYNSDGLINAADYVAWRKLQSQFGAEPGYQAWKQQFGQSSPGAGGAVPEPTSAILLILGIACVPHATSLSRTTQR
jgi:hypothetical protein